MKGNYIFPNILAKMMKGISQRTQYEASMMSVVCILIGLIIITIYTSFFSPLSIAIKVMSLINGIAAFIFLSSFLVTSFQQYQNYLMIMGIINDERR